MGVCSEFPVQPVSEPIQQPPQVVTLNLGTLCFAGPAADFIEQITGPTIDIFVLQQALIRAQLATGVTLFAAKRILTVRRVLTKLVALFALTLLLLLGHRLAKATHPFTECLHGRGLVVDRFGKIILAERLFGVVHRIARAAQSLARGIAFRCSSTRHVALLTVQLIS